MALTTVNAQMVSGAITADSSGNVGIGTSSPTTKTQVSATTGGSTTGLSVVASGNMLNIFGSSSTNAGVILDATNGTVGSATAVPTIFRGGGTERMRIDSSGYVTTPYQPCWYVYKSDGNTSTSGPIVYNGVQINVGSGYNASNGRFTAPVAGTYMITMSGISASSVNVESSVNLNGGAMIGSARGGSNASSTQAGYSTTFFYTLAAGDYLQVNVAGAAAQYGFGYYTYFAGRLVG